MATTRSKADSIARGAGDFAPTRWSVVLAARRSQSTHARDALETLCRTYWQPIYAFIRRQGQSPPDAQDLTQEFLARLLEKRGLEKVGPSKGRFRSFLLASLKHFLANEWDKARAQKRGGGYVLVPFDTQLAEAGCGLESAAQHTAEKTFERRWALTLLAQVLARLRAEYASGGKTELFEHLKAALSGEGRSVPYAEIATRLKMSEGALRVAVHRLRQRYRELLREEIAHTVSSKEEVEEEIRALFAALED